MPPFALDGHSWLPHDWLNKIPAYRVLKCNGPGELSLVRVGPSTRCFPQPTESVEVIKNWTKEHHDSETERFCSDKGATANLFVRARFSADATLCIGIQTDQFFAMLKELAVEGNRTAIEYVLSLTKQGCVFLKELAEQKPKSLRPLARRSWRWPVMKSPHPMLSDDEEIVFRNLQLGQDTPIEVHPSARWVTDAAGKIAFGLLLYLHDARERDVGTVGRLTRKLPKFTDDSAEDWWQIGRALILLAYPNPETVSELSALVAAPSHRKSGGRLRFRILKKLHERFLSLAPPPA